MGAVEGEKELIQEEVTNKFDGFVSQDPVILDAFTDVKNAIMAKRTDIVRQILCAAQALREEDEFDSDGEECDKKDLRDKYDREEFLDLLSLLLLHRDTDSGTLLHHATRADCADIVRALLAAGANCTVNNTENLNAYAYCQSERMKNVYVGELMQAVSQCRIYRIQQLLAAGIDVNSCDGGAINNSVLHWAVSFGDLATVKLIIESGGDVNLKNANGEAPLHDAVSRGDEHIVEELLKNGAEVDVIPSKGSKEGKSPVDLSAKNGDIENMLKSYHAKNLSKSTNEEDTVFQNGQVPNKDESSNTIDHVNTDTLPKQPVTKKPSESSVTSLIPSKVDIDLMFSSLCPQPQFIQQFEGLFFVPPTELTIQVISQTDQIVSLKEIWNLFVKKFKSIGVQVNYEYHNNRVPTKTPKGSFLQCMINDKIFTHKQEYKIQFNTHKVLIISSDLPSMFYGVSTFVQTLQLFKGKAIPLVQICDWPMTTNRAVIFDFHNNDLPKNRVFHELVDLFAQFKVNQLQVNVDHVTGNNGRIAFGEKDFYDFQFYCKQRYIEVSPYIILDKDSQYLSGKSINENDFLKETNNFVFSSHLHVNAKNIDVQKILNQVQSFCGNQGMVLQLTTDRNLDMHLEQATSLMNNFFYSFNVSTSSDFESQVQLPNSLGFQYSVCVDDAALRRVCPNHVKFLSAVQTISSQLPQHNCYGFCTRFTKDSKQLGNVSLLLPSLLISASMGWNTPASINETYVQSVTNYLIYEDDHDIIGLDLHQVGNCLPFHYQSKSLFHDIMESCSVSSKTLTQDTIQDFVKQLKVLKQNLENMKLNFQLSQLVYDELAMLTEILYFVSKLSYSALSQMKDKEEIDFCDLSSVTKSDSANKLMVIIKQYEAFVSTYYRPTSSSTYNSVDILKNILRQLLLSSTTMSTPNLMGVFDV